MNDIYPPLPHDALSHVKNYLLTLQTRISQALETLDGKAQFLEDSWQRPGAGGGITRILTQGNLFAKAGVNFSHVYGESLPEAATAARVQLAGRNFHAMGVSVVVHPENPYIPTTHANIRFLLAKKPGEAPVWWFGGGFDLTPYYGFKEDCIHWHAMARGACDTFGAELYPRFKDWCDRYFYLPHRREPRGIGGLFFDDYHQVDFTHSFNLAQSIGDHFLKGYLPIVIKRQAHPYGETEKRFQLYRRGRYVEFNLLYDRGTLFGLQSGGRTESILMSLPPEVHWTYNLELEKDSREANLYSDFLQPRDWLAGN